MRTIASTLSHIVVLLLLVGACNDAPVQTIGGTVTGLTGAGLTATVNGDTPAPITADGAFTLGAFPRGTNYTVAVSANPTMPWQTCDVTNGMGTIGTADVSNVMIDCTTNPYTVSGIVRGLGGSSLVLGLGAETVGVTTPGAPTIDAPFAFTMPIDSGETYDVFVETYPNSP